MEAETLQIQVHEQVSVLDIIADRIKRVVDKIRQAWAWMFSDEPEEEENQDEQDGRAPPTLGINVSEGINAGDRFGR